VFQRIERERPRHEAATKIALSYRKVRRLGWDGSGAWLE
jgi:hypothetical protein